MEHKGDYMLDLKEALKELYLLNLRPLHQGICPPQRRLSPRIPVLVYRQNTMVQTSRNICYKVENFCYISFNMDAERR